VLSCYRIFEQFLAKTTDSSLQFFTWFPVLPPPSTFEVCTRFPPENDLDVVINALKVPSFSPTVTLSYLHHHSFPVYDMFVAVSPGNNRPVELWGYQCKASKLPTGETHAFVDHSIVLRSKILILILPQTLLVQDG
jgi:hypothetical protein